MVDSDVQSLEHLLGLRHLTSGQIRTVLIAKRFKNINERKIKKVPTLGGTVVNFFGNLPHGLGPALKSQRNVSLRHMSFNASSSSFVKEALLTLREILKRCSLNGFFVTVRPVHLICWQTLSMQRL